MYSDILKNTVLFHGMDEDEISRALSALNSLEKEYEKDEMILHAGSSTKLMGFVLEGSVSIESNDYWGNRTILTHANEGEFFAETYALLKDEPLMVDVIANKKCRILFLRVSSIESLQEEDENWRNKFVTNLLYLLSHKTLILSARNFHTAPKTIRERLMAYLNSVSLKKGSREFDIPFDRQQLADYLNLERTALSKEIGKMQRDGIITADRSHFIINHPDGDV